MNCLLKWLGVVRGSRVARRPVVDLFFLGSLSVLCSMPLVSRAQEDYGDAPAPYPTLFSADGARHKIVSGIVLGTAITAETNGQPDISAALDSGDDGVTFLTPLVRGADATIRVIASASGRLDAWIDFNANGSWNEPGEQIFVSSLLSQGVNTLTFFVPLNAHVGATYARFRFSTSGDLRPTGLARDGEVEDYRVSIIASSADLAIGATISPNPVPSLGGRCFLTVVNVGPSFAPNVVISNRLSGVKLISATSTLGTSTIQLDPVNCEIGNMQPGETRSVVISFRPLAQGIISDTASVRSDASDPNLSNNVATATARAAPPLVITEPLQNQKVIVGSSASFNVEAKGVPPLTYQWFINGSGLATATGSTLTLLNVSQSATISVKVGDALGGVQTSSALLDVVKPVDIIRQPNNLVHSIGSPFQLVAEADGSAPLQLQWRLNGANVRNALGPTYDVERSTRADGGSYTLVVGNDAGLKFTETAIVTCADIPTYPGSDTLNGATQLPPPGISPFQGAVQGDTFNATREPGEPDHDGRPGGASVWYQWIAPANGLATFDTIGSTFDTVLAVYQRNATGIIPVASDDDSGGYFRSLVRFNAQSNQTYWIVVDGLGGRRGIAVLGWTLQPILEPLPIILSQPRSQSALSNGLVTLSVQANDSANKPYSYQWFFNGVPTNGATTRNFVISGLKPGSVGTYAVRVATSSGLFVESKPAIVEIGPIPHIVSRDKLEDLFLNDSQNGPGAMAMAASGLPPFVSVSVGIPGSQVLNNTNSTADIDCFAIGTATRWLGLQVAADAPPGSILQIDTDGSPIPTEVAVYRFTGALSCFQNLSCMNANRIGCDTNSAGGTFGRVTFSPVPSGQYIAFADGIGGAMGLIDFNWQLGLPPILDSTKSNCTLLYPTGAVVVLSSGFTNGIPTPSYQWYYCGTPLTDQTNASLAFNPIQAADAGCYSVIASNFAGVVTNSCCVIVDPPLLRYATDWEAYPPACNISAALLPDTILQSALDVTPVIAWQSVITNAVTNCTFQYSSPLFDPYGDPVPQCFFRTRKP